MRGHGWYTEAGADVEGRACGKAYDPVSRQVCVLLRGAGGPLMAGEIHPDAITDGKVVDALPERVNHTRTVLVRSYLRKWRRCTVAGAKAGLPVGGVDAGDEDVDADLARARFGQIAIDELQNRRVTCTRVDDRLHASDNRVTLLIIP